MIGLVQNMPGAGSMGVVEQTLIIGDVQDDIRSFCGRHQPQRFLQKLSTKFISIESMCAVPGQRARTIGRRNATSRSHAGAVN